LNIRLRQKARVVSDGRDDQANTKPLSRKKKPTPRKPACHRTLFMVSCTPGYMPMNAVWKAKTMNAAMNRMPVSDRS
jgi:hypothetical protein